MALAKTLQFAWFVGHLTLILSVVRYSFSWIRMSTYGRMAQFSYRLGFIAAAATYGIVVFKMFRSRQKAGARMPNGPIGLLADENLQYLVLALVWLFSPQYFVAMVPYAIYSVFHIATYTRSNLIPTIQPPTVVGPPAGNANAKPQYAPNPVADALGAFVKQHHETSMYAVSAMEMLIWLRIFFAAIFFQRRSWFILALYSAFLRTRYAQSVHVQNTFSQLEARIDSLVGSQGTPPAARQVWDGLKRGIRQFHDATDVTRHMAGSAPPKKTS